MTRSPTLYGPDVDLAAPGVDIVSTVPTSGSPAGLFDPTGYNSADGTSVAAAYASGAAALYLASHPGASPDQVRSALIADSERVALQGDPDGINEGVLNVNDGAPWADGNDTTPPTGPSLTITENEPNEFAAGTTLFYNPAKNHEGVFTVVVSTSDPESGIAKVHFPNLFGGGDSNDSTPPYEKNYRWKDDDRTARTRGVTATNRAGLSSTTNITVIPDMSNPILVTDDYFIDFDDDVLKVRALDVGSGLAKAEIRWCPGTCNWASATLLFVDTTLPFEFTWTTQPIVKYTLLAQVWDNVGRASGVKSVTINPVGLQGSAATQDDAIPSAPNGAEETYERPLGVEAASSPRKGDADTPRQGTKPSKDRGRRDKGHHRKHHRQRDAVSAHGKRGENRERRSTREASESSRQRARAKDSRRSTAKPTPRSQLPRSELPASEKLNSPSA